PGPTSLTKTGDMRGMIMNLTRAGDHLYRIKAHERRSIYAGMTADNNQVLMGLYCPHLVAIFFDGRGSVLEVQQPVLSFMVEQIERGAGTDTYDARIEPLLETWQEEVGYQPATIQVRKFFVLEQESKQARTWGRSGIGIEDYPSWFQDVLANPDDETLAEE